MQLRRIFTNDFHLQAAVQDHLVLEMEELQIFNLLHPVNGGIGIHTMQDSTQIPAGHQNVCTPLPKLSYHFSMTTKPCSMLVVY